ncbi:MAG: LamG domain-containing protein, partial [Bacteroidetes bacterium]
PATFVDWGQPLFLGAASAAGTAEDHAVVSLDQVRFWTRARTDRQVREAMHHPLTGAEPGLVAYWLFDEGTGSTAADLVGGHDGTFVGGDGWTPATMPFGPGVFAQETEANGLIDFAGTGLSADYLAHSGSVVGVDRIDRTPENPPGGTAIEVFEGAHWLLTRYTGGPFSADLTFSTTGLTADDAAAPGRIKLFRRDGNSDGTWTLSASAAAVDEAAGTVTFAGVSKSGQYVLARGEEAPAVAGTALDFDGTDDFVRAPGLVLPNTFTIEMWINPQSGTDGRAFIAKDTGDNGSGYGSEDLFNIGFYDGSLRVFLRNKKLLAGPRVTGQQHLAVVVQQTGTSSLVTVYRNGVQIAQGTLAAVLDDDGSGPDWTFGQNWVFQALAKAQADPPAGDFFDGTLDEVRIWTTAR